MDFVEKKRCEIFVLHREPFVKFVFVLRDPKYGWQDSNFDGQKFITSVFNDLMSRLLFLFSHSSFNKIY